MKRLAWIAASTAAAALAAACAATPAETPALAAAAPEQVVGLPTARLYASPSLSGPTPRALRFSPDGRRLTFLKPRAEDRQRLDLWAMDVASGAQSLLVDSTLLEPEERALSEAEAARRERQRIAGLRGIVDYAWDATGRRLLVPAGGDLFAVDLEAAGAPQVTRLTETAAFETDPKLSPAGGYVSFIRDGALWVRPLDGRPERRVSPAAAGAVSYGVAEFVAQEEMDRASGQFWSPDDRRIAFTRVDESGVDIIPRLEIGPDGGALVEQRYPRAGRPNAKVGLFVADLATGRTLRVALEPSPDVYLARVDWAGPDRLFIQRVGRDQTALELLRVDLATGALIPAHVERQATWINLSDDFRPLKDGRILWTTEERGFRHIVLLDADGRNPVPVTAGDWPVKAIVGVDETAGEVFFTGWTETPLRQGLYRARYGAGAPQAPVRVTSADADWTIDMARDGRAFVGRSSTPTLPPQTALYDRAGARIAWIEENRLDAAHPYAPFRAAHRAPEFGTLPAADGQTLHWSLLKPPGFDPAKRYPVLVRVYGGPGVQTVRDAWGSLEDQLYAQRGYLVFRLDNRGSANRGRRFEDPLHRRLGGVEVEDQLAGIAMLQATPFVDRGRIAVEGWSYGGTMALTLALRAPKGTFAAAIVGAPVTDWALYDTFYTERYMDAPADNPEGYSAASALGALERLETPILLMHGMADDNVTFDNSTRVMAALQARAAPFELMTYPGQRHGLRDPARQRHALEARLDFLARRLGPPPVSERPAE